LVSLGTTVFRTPFAAVANALLSLDLNLATVRTVDLCAAHHDTCCAYDFDGDVLVITAAA
jgi:hypothetical protein